MRSTRSISFKAKFKNMKEAVLNLDDNDDDLCSKPEGFRFIERNTGANLLEIQCLEISFGGLGRQFWEDHEDVDMKDETGCEEEKLVSFKRDFGDEEVTDHLDDLHPSSLPSDFRFYQLKMVLCMWNLRGPHTIAPHLDNDYIHDLNDMICEIGYSADDTMDYHYRIPNLDLDFGLKALGNDQDVISMTQFVPQNRVINVIRPKKKGIGSCSKKLDMNVPLKESNNQAQRKDGVYDYSMSLVPFEPNKQDMVNELKDDSYFPVPKETDIMQEITVDINYQNHRERLDDFEPFSSDGYQNMGEFEREVEAEEEQDEEDEKENAEDSKDDSEEHTAEDDDSNYIVDPEAILDDWEVDMREFHSCVDGVEWFGQGPNI
ncbi:unnamed protein product [Lactuca saligna]|uniref:Uncharacterized protein n=1 Tax=Lactuca saligna TaxID=75948 RepID=A0AA36EM68_LACSI|nr:unnamed protein product [Lactuca saligna]